MVKKTYGGLNPALTTTIKSKLHIDLGLFGFPSYVCCSWHPISSRNVKGNQIHVQTYILAANYRGNIKVCQS